MSFTPRRTRQTPQNFQGRLCMRLMSSLAFALLGMSLLSGAGWSQVPHDMTYQGQLTDSVGAPLSGPVNLELRIFDVLSGGSALYAEDHIDVSLDDDGGFSVQLGAGVASTGSFDPALFSGVNRYLEVVVDTVVLAPRQVLASVPWALVAEEASTLQGLDVVAQLGALSTSVATAQSSADNAQSDAASAQAAADANTGAVSGLNTDLAAIEDDLGELPDGPSVAETLNELEEVAVSDNSQKDTPLTISAPPISATSLVISPWWEVPLVNYREPSSGDLMLAYCDVALPTSDCSGSTSSLVVGEGDDTGDYSSDMLSGYDYPMVVVNENPLIAFMSFNTYPSGAGPESSTILKVTYCEDPFECGTGTETSLAFASVDNSNGSSENIRGVAIALGSDGLALLSYYESDAYWDPWDFENPNYNVVARLKVVHCSSEACTSFTTTTIHTSSAGVYSANTSIAIGGDGLARISFHDEETDDLMLAHCDDLACTTATISTLDSTGDVGSVSSVAIGEDDIPIVSYYDDTGDDLKVARCNNSTCTSTTVSTLDTEGTVGSRNFIGIGPCGLPVVSYYDATNKNVKLARCVDTGCENAMLSVVASEGSVGAGLSMAMLPDGAVLMSYFNAESGDLEMATAQAGYLWDAVCMAKDMASGAQATADSADTAASDAQAAAAAAQAAADAAQAAADSIVGGCGTLRVALVCPIGAVDGPRCDTILPGGFCEGDGECGTSVNEDNCGIWDWYFKTGS